MDGLVGDEEYESESVYTVDTASSLIGRENCSTWIVRMK